MVHRAEARGGSAAQKQFDEEASRIQTALSERMSVYQDVLHGGVGLFAASYSVERSEWKAYVDTVSVTGVFPAWTDSDSSRTCRGADKWTPFSESTGEDKNRRISN